MNSKLTELLLSGLRNYFRMTPNEVEVYLSDNPIPVIDIEILTEHLQRRIEAELCVRKEHTYWIKQPRIGKEPSHICVNCGREKE